MRDSVEKTIKELRNSCSYTMLNYRVFQKLKPLGYGKFNLRLNKTLCFCFTYVTSFDFRA